MRIQFYSALCHKSTHLTELPLEAFYLELGLELFGYAEYFPSNNQGKTWKSKGMHY